MAISDQDGYDGGQALVKALENEGIEYLFGLSGGAALPIFDALVSTDNKMKFVLVRHEQGASHMADGYARATGKPAVVLVTSGPGATNTLTGIMTAHMDSVPMLVVTGQQVTGMLGKDAFQEADIFGITMPIVKHSYLVKETDSIPRIVREAYHIATTGRPGPVLIDVPKDVSQTLMGNGAYQEMDIPGYQVPEEGDRDVIVQVAAALNAAQRPVILAGHGALIAKASDSVRRLAERLQAPVTTTLLGKGAFPETHPLSLGMLGMHGTAYANKAVVECDLVMSIGSRFDDRIIGQADRFCRNATVIHIDIDPGERGKMIEPDHFIQGDARLVTEELIKHVTRLDTEAWLRKLDRYKVKYPLKYRKQGGLKMQHVIDELYRLTEGKAIVSTDVGQHQMWAAQFYKTDYPENWLSSGGAGTMGYGFPAAIGRPVRAARRSGGGHRRRRRLSDDAVRAGHGVHPQAAAQGDRAQQPLPGHGAAVAGTVLRRARKRRRSGGQPRLRQAGRGIRRQGLQPAPSRRRTPGADRRTGVQRRPVRDQRRGGEDRQRVSDDPGRQRPGGHDRGAANREAGQADRIDLMAMNNGSIHTLSALVANKPGVLARIAQVFARRGFNIESAGGVTLEGWRLLAHDHRHQRLRSTGSARSSPRSTS